ncbi:MAG: MarR family winged helix-turn-helix transcriptional regulator [Alphaproteobacteria bacterium]
MASTPVGLSADERATCERIAGICPSASLKKTSRAVSRYFDDALQPVGLRSGQLVMLMTIAVLERPTYGQLARDLVMDSSTIARSLRPLERDGLIELVSGPDRRRKSVQITADGLDRIRTAMPHWERAQQHFLGQVGSKTWDSVLKGLAATLTGTKGL